MDSDGNPPVAERHVVRFLRAIRLVQSGSHSIEKAAAGLPRAFKMLLIELGNSGAMAPRGALIGKLSPRMVQVAHLLIEGYTQQEAADALGLQRHTVHDYVKQIYRRLGVHSRAQLLACYRSAVKSP